jgi:hypothetical protein
VTLTAALVVCATAVQLVAAPPLATGRVVGYSPGVFREVAQNRGMPLLRWHAGHRIAGYASTRWCHRVDTVADPTLRHRPWLVEASINGSPRLVVQVIDCSADVDRPRHIATGLILEVNYDLARKHRIDPTNDDVTIWRIFRP